MDFTESYSSVLPPAVLARYEVRETRNAAKVLQATNPDEFEEIVEVLEAFELAPDDITGAGGNKSDVARRLDVAFRELGWREGRHDTRITSALRLMPYAPAGEKKPTTVMESEVFNEAYKVDNVKGRVALDVEWNAKDGNLDRDVGAYRALYDAGILDGAVIVTRTLHDLRQLAIDLGADKKFNTTTTTNLTKLEPRLTRGDAGGCPVLAIAITSRCLK